ncbi:putative prolyl-tRNA synthetase, putative,bifunctional aminoacyl-tRNA synthetase [Trypanosoma theileri]|uniref:proline--tRNA ligase n=1 Tax=Trypanosoma theileri TaxID=67003 RepID=A0A1X0P793_9TRYP|nr:putative prolyl-tRNA synthetase, putative,bifunctional aminoacyl-tRNA synthetase [Trypanosoma theileri]ORC92715.1 putative prolyl-tRNA synthetase, putative,bifunctional aminoacyl-tRNA synthetase [Trypanosoma theileri]
MRRARGILFPSVFRLGLPQKTPLFRTAPLKCGRAVLYCSVRPYHHHRADGTDAKLFPGFSSFNNPNKEQATKSTKLMSASDCKGEAELLEVLRSLDMDLPTISHEEKHTVEEANKELERFGTPCIGVKNMFLKSKKNELVLVTALHTTKTNMKMIQKAADTKDLRFAPEDVLMSKLGVVQGSVTPFALINDSSKGIKLIIDKALMDSPIPVVLHPCRNDKSTLITPKQLCQFLDKIGYKYVVVDFSEENASTEATGTDSAAAKEKPEANKQNTKNAGKKSPPPSGGAGSNAVNTASGETKLGIMAKREENFAQWYTEVITKGEMIEYYDVSGCYIMRPWSFFIWSRVQKFLGSRIEKMGVEDCYFPMFVSKSCLEREKDHVEGFAPEVAWVTRAGETDLEVPIGIRPTSETVMYPYYAKWIRSHRDLPVRLNMWNSVIRWEFSHPTPFIRTREFLWQEGHCAWQTEEECADDVLQILDHYAAVYEELLAVPVVKGKKTEKEKFAGGYYTTTVETYIAPVGRGCQGGTSHNLGQNFGKMFNINFQDPEKNDGSTLIPWQNSWGLSTRVIGVMIMVHGDDRGLVLPPRVANVQVVIIPVGITKDTTDEERETLLDKCKVLEKDLINSGLRAKADLRDNYSPGWRFNHWEVKGVPVRIELGPKELSSQQLSVALRYNNSRRTVPWNEQLPSTFLALMDEIHDSMLVRAAQERQENTKKLTEWEDFTPAINNKALVLAPWCGSMACEEQIKKDSAEESKILQSEETRDDARAPSMGAKSLCIPFQQPEGVEGRTCICKSCNNQAKEWVLFGRSY